VEFASLIAADRIVGEVTREGPLIAEEKDAMHQVIALAAAGGWLYDIVKRDWFDGAKREGGLPC
jgi:hypothetical protein